MNNPDTLEELLNVYPFIMKNSNLKITQEIIYDLYLNSNSFTQDIDKYKFPDNSTEDYLIKFSKKNEAIVIKIYKEQNLLLPIGDILPKPYSILVEGDPKLKKFYIFKENNYIKLITFMNGKKDKYSYTEDKSNKTIKIQIKKYFISSENINEMLACKNNIMVKKEDLPNLNAKIVEIDPLNLSLNFYTIYNEVEETKKFEFLLNEERIDFLKSLYNFLSSDKIFYYITGSDGIGKSLSLLYFTLMNNSSFVYFNIKIYESVKDHTIFKELFRNDLHKLFLFNSDKSDIDCINFDFSNCFEQIEENVKKNKNNGIKKIFNYIREFISSYAKEEYTIIIDQYKSDLSDENFEGLNAIINEIIAYKEVLKVKLIVSSSIDNTSNKYSLLNNLSDIYFSLKSYNIKNIIYNENLNNINLIYNENLNSIENPPKNALNIKGFNYTDQCKFYENVFKKEKEARKLNIKNEKIEYHTYKYNEKCLLDVYKDITTKVCYFSLVDGKNIYNDKLSESEKAMVENFGFSIKYIIKYLKYKKNAKKKDDEDDSKFEDRIIQGFYEIQAEKMKTKIDKFYEDLYKLDDYRQQFTNYVHLEFQSLCRLRSYIFYQNKFNINDLANQLLLFPMKYLQIVINDYDECYFPIKKYSEFNNYSFKINYNNNFIRIQINNIIGKLFKNISNVSINSFRGSGEGTFLEMKIDEAFRDEKMKIFGINDLECRYLFTLVQNTQNSKKAIQDHRLEEKKMLFFDKNNYHIPLDDIDKELILKTIPDHYKLNKKYYYFSQVSLTGRAFDMCILEKVSENTYKLYLIQSSKNKDDELGTKYYYFNQGDNVARNLVGLYNISISQKYLIFVLPNSVENDDFKKKLKEKSFTYILFDTNTCDFYNSDNKKIEKFEFENAILDTKTTLDTRGYDKVYTHYMIFENSLKAYINQGNNNKKSLYEIYTNKFYDQYMFNLIKLELDKDFIQCLFKTVISDEKAVLHYLGYFNLEFLDSVKQIHKMINIFIKGGKAYINYDLIFSLEKNKNGYEIKEIDANKINSDKTLHLNEFDSPNLTTKPKKKKIEKISLDDLLNNKIKYNEECFCFLVITENYLKDFYFKEC